MPFLLSNQHVFTTNGLVPLNDNRKSALVSRLYGTLFSNAGANVGARVGIASLDVPEDSQA
jgi:hypothetical protein